MRFSFGISIKCYMDFNSTPTICKSAAWCIYIKMMTGIRILKKVYQVCDDKTTNN